MDYEGSGWRGKGTFFDGKTSRANPVQVAISSSGISVHGDGIGSIYSANNLRIVERRSDGHVRIEVKQPAGAAIVIESRDAAAALAANNLAKAGLLPGLSANAKAVCIASLIVLFIAFFAVYGLDAVVKHGLALVPEETEEMIGETVFKEFAGKQILTDDGPTLRVLQKCAAVVQAFDTTRKYNITISIVEDTETKNAFALPGGHIVVYRALLDAMENESEFWGVLAHEAGHIYLRHGLRRIARAAIVGFAVTALIGDAGGLSAILLDKSSMLLNLAYDRKEERAADEFAALHLGRAGMNQSGLVTLLRKIDEEGGGAEWMSYLSTHPATEERIDFPRQRIDDSATSAPILTEQEWRTLTGKAHGEAKE